MDFSIQIYMYAYLWTYIYLKYLYLMKKRRKSRKKTMYCYDFAVDRKVNLTVKRWLTFWKLIISEADQRTQDSSSRSKITGLHPSRMMRQDCRSRLFPVSTWYFGPDFFLCSATAHCPAPDSRGKLGFINEEALGKVTHVFLLHNSQTTDLTSSKENVSRSFLSFTLTSSAKLSIKQSIRFIKDRTKLVSEVGDNS